LVYWWGLGRVKCKISFEPSEAEPAWPTLIQKKEAACGRPLEEEETNMDYCYLFTCPNINSFWIPSQVTVV